MISTKTGDKGKTQWDTKRLTKDCPNFDFIGDLDELSAMIGVVRSHLSVKHRQLNRWLIDIQQDLMLISSLQAFESMVDLDEVVNRLNKRLRTLETQMNQWELQLKPQKSFIILGGSRPAALTQLARAISRRVERRAVAYFNSHPKAPGKPVILAYLNRLSDYLYLLARRLNQLAGVAEVPW